MIETAMITLRLRMSNHQRKMKIVLEMMLQKSSKLPERMYIKLSKTEGIRGTETSKKNQKKRSTQLGPALGTNECKGDKLIEATWRMKKRKQKVEKPETKQEGDKSMTVMKSKITVSQMLNRSPRGGD